MFRLLTIVGSLLSLCSCHSPTKSSGDADKANTASANKVNYTVYGWYADSNTQRWEIAIHSILRIEPNGEYKLLKRSKSGSTAYFKGKLSASLMQSIQGTLYGNHIYDTMYTLNPTRSYLYHGYHYVLDYLKNGRKHFIQFIPPEAPSSIQHLSSRFDSLILNGKANRADSVDFGNYEQEVITQTKQRVKVPPLPKIEKTTFAPAKIHKEPANR